MTWTDDDRRELRELFRVHDQMMAEQRANDPGEELVFKVMEDQRNAANYISDRTPRRRARPEAAKASRNNSEVVQMISPLLSIITGLIKPGSCFSRSTCCMAVLLFAQTAECKMLI